MIDIKRYCILHNERYRILLVIYVLSAILFLKEKCKIINKSTHKKEVLGYVIDVEKFWSGIKKLGENDCWEWQRGKNTTGYGLFSVRNTEEQWERTGRATSQVLAHRLVAALTMDVKPEDYVMHKCDNRSCCNPAHLQVGTALDNYLDMVSKGRAGWQKKRATYSVECKS